MIMADIGDEKLTFGKLTKCHSQYGTTSSAASSRVDHADSFVRHAVQIGDTLQGIAVKYGVAIERIKRANNLWTNDSLFLRDHLLIPVPSNSPEQQHVTGFHISHEQLPHGTIGYTKMPMSPHRCKERVPRSQSIDIAATVALTAEAAADLNQVNIDEYFSKYDSLLAKLKNDASKFNSDSRHTSNAE